MAANLIHAAGESSPGNLDSGTYAIALEAEDEYELRDIAEHLSSKDVQFKLIVESHGEYAGQAMAIGVVPGPRKKLRKYLSSYPLVKRYGEARRAYVLDVQNCQLKREIDELKNRSWWKRLRGWICK